MKFKNKINVTLEFIAVGVMALCGVLSSMNKLDIPGWVFILLFAIWLLLALTGWSDKKPEDLKKSGRTGGEIGDDDDEDGDGA